MAVYKYQQDPKNRYIVTDIKGNTSVVLADTAEHARRVWCNKRGLAIDKYMWKIKVQKIKE